MYTRVSYQQLKKKDTVRFRPATVRTPALCVGKKQDIYQAFSPPCDERVSFPVLFSWQLVWLRMSFSLFSFVCCFWHKYNHMLNHTMRPSLVERASWLRSVEVHMHILLRLFARTSSLGSSCRYIISAYIEKAHTKRCPVRTVWMSVYCKIYWWFVVFIFFYKTFPPYSLHLKHNRILSGISCVAYTKSSLSLCNWTRARRQTLGLQTQHTISTIGHHSRHLIHAALPLR